MIDSLLEFIPLTSLNVAIACSLIFGIIGFKTPPLWAFIKVIAAVFYKRLNRKGRSKRARTIRGIITLVLFLATILFSARAFSNLLPTQTSLILFEGIILGSLISTSHVWFFTFKSKKKINKEAVQKLTQDDLSKTDDFILRKQLITFQARSLDRFLIAPLFFYFIGGFMALLTVMTLSALTFASHYKTSHSLDYSYLIKKCDDIALFIPARIAGFIICLISLIAPFASFNKCRTSLNQASNFNGLNAGWVISAMAGALNITLAGPALQEDKSTDQPWIGPKNSSVKIENQHLIKGAFLHLYSVIFTLSILMIAF